MSLWHRLGSFMTIWFERHIAERVSVFIPNSEGFSVLCCHSICISVNVFLIQAKTCQEGICTFTDLVVGLSNICLFNFIRCFDANLVDVAVEIETPDHHCYHVLALASFTSLYHFLDTTVLSRPLLSSYSFLFLFAACVIHYQKNRCHGRTNLGEWILLYIIVV